MCADSYGQKDVIKPYAPGQKGSTTAARNQFTSMQRQGCERIFLNARLCIFSCEIRYVYSSWTLHHRTHLFLESCLCDTEKGPGLANGQDGISQLSNWTPAPAPGRNSAAHEHQSPQVTKCTFFLKVLKHWPILCWAALPQLQINRGKIIARSVSNEISTEKRAWLKLDFCCPLLP